MSDTVHFLCKGITNPTKTVADKIMLAISHVSDLIENNGNTEEIEAEEAIRELERLAQATNKAQQDGTLNKQCDGDETGTRPRVQEETTTMKTSAFPRVQEEATNQPPESYDYIDPERPVTRSMSHIINNKQIKVDEIPSLKERVPKVDRRMDNVTKSTTEKRKQ